VKLIIFFFTVQILNDISVFMKTIVFFGGGELLISIIDALHRFKYDKIFIYTSKRHVNEKVRSNKRLKNFLIKKKCNFIVKNELKISEIKARFNFKKIICISVGSPWLFNSNFIKKLKYNIYNIHGSDLPVGRGGGGFTWQILQEGFFGYISIHQLSSGIDKGNIIFKEKFNRKNCKSPLEFQKIYIKKATILFMKFFKKIIKNKKIMGKKQNEKISTYWPRLNTQLHGWINWDWNAEEIYKFIKAFSDPYLGAHTTINNKIVYVKECELEKTKKFHPFQSGLVYRKDKKNLFISAKNGSLLVKKIFDKNGNSIQKNFIKLGDRFFTPNKKLEEAKKKRIFYNQKSN